MRYTTERERERERERAHKKNKIIIYCIHIDRSRLIGLKQDRKKKLIKLGKSGYMSKNAVTRLHSAARPQDGDTDGGDKFSTYLFICWGIRGSYASNGTMLPSLREHNR